MSSELFEKVEYLRENADIGYEEASDLLERFGGDVTKAMIELERANRVRRPADADRGESAWDNMFTRGKEHIRSAHESNWFRRLMKARMQVTRDGEQVADVPVIAPIVAAVFLPHVAIISAVVGGLAGYRVRGAEPTKEEQ